MSGKEEFEDAVDTVEGDDNEAAETVEPVETETSVIVEQPVDVEPVEVVDPITDAIDEATDPIDSPKKKNKKKKKSKKKNGSTDAVDTETAENDATDITEDTEVKAIEPEPIGESTQELTEEDLKKSNKSLEEKLDMLYEDPDATDATDAADATPVPPPIPSREVPPPLPSREVPLPPLPPRDVPALPPRTDEKKPDETERNISKQMQLSQTAATLQPPPLPPQLSQKQKQHHRGSIFQWFSSSPTESVDDKEVTYEENYDMLLSRLNENSADLSTKDDVSKEQINSNHNTLKSSFNDTVSSIDDSSIDWEFWSQVVNDYSSIAKSDPSRLSKELSNGIPYQIRGIVWQLVANVNPKEFESSYKELYTRDSKYEKSITNDLSRTSFVNDTKVDKDSLFRVIKAYSNIDTEVGYTQGMAFIAVPLLLNLSELDSFTMLHKLMYHYTLRLQYLPEMPGLLVQMYQFDRLLEDQLPSLSTHLQRQGVRSSMYASQWFLTLFAYKFPLDIVLRIYDLVITEGFESILKFALALMIKNVDTLLTLQFDELLEFLKNQLFCAYEADDSYLVDQLVQDATEVKILPMTLSRYAEEFEEIHREEKERREEVDELKFKNNQMKREIRKVEASYTILNREHVQIANEMINGRMKFAELEDENNDLKKQNQLLRERIKTLQDIPLPPSLEEDLKTTMQRNLEVMNKNQELEDQMQSLLQEVEDLKMQLESSNTTPPSPVTSAKPSLWGKKLFK